MELKEFGIAVVFMDEQGWRAEEARVWPNVLVEEELKR